MPRKSKAYNQRMHAKRRLKERYDIDYTPSLRTILINTIQRGNARFLRRTSNRTTVWRILIGSKSVICVYDKNRKEIVTFLPNKKVR